MGSEIEKQAQEYARNGLSIIPVNREKRPTVPEWKEFQERIASPYEIEEWFSKNRNVAIVCGEVSANSEVIDFDCEAEALKQWATLVQEQNKDLLNKVVMEKSPHGVHVIYKCKEATIPGNQKLARKAIEVPGPGEHQYRGKRLKAQKINGVYYIVPELIETRGEGGYCVISPSEGYELIQGDFLNIPVITPEERDILIECARALNQWVSPSQIYRGPSEFHKNPNLPGSDFNERGDVRPTLKKHGWEHVGNGHDGRERWRRPGKDKGHSATLTDGKVFYVFSSNGHPFEAGRAYNPFAVYALLEHGGDFHKASRALAAEGYGTSPKAKNPKGRKPRFLNVKDMEKEFGKETKMIFRDDLIPEANPCLFVAREGNGKSTNVAQISKEIVSKDPNAWVLWVATEGFVGDHSDKWHKLRMSERVVMLSDDKGEYKLQLDSWKDQKFLDEAIETLEMETGGKVVAVVIDSIRGMQRMGENDPKLANVMSAINSIVCDKHKAACIYIAHLKKGQEQNRLNRVAGSTAITSSVRAVYTVERISEFVCRIIPDKSNTLGHNPKTYKSILIQTDDGYEISIVEDDSQDDETAKSKAERFLISLFKEKTEYLATEIYKLGAIEGLSSTVLKKAKKNLPIKVVHEGVGAPWIWKCDLYKQNQAPLGKTEKMEEKKPNKINKGAKSDKNLGISTRVPQECQEGQGCQEYLEELEWHSSKKQNRYNNLSNHFCLNSDYLIEGEI